VEAGLFKLTIREPGRVIEENLTEEHNNTPLLVAYSVIIPALCMGMVPHYTVFSVDEDNTNWGVSVWIVREPYVMETHNLIVDQGPILPGEIFTRVFNLSNKALKIRKGEAISRLMLVAGSRIL
jgi:hypothetical protein